MRWLCPATTKGRPGKETPVTSKVPDFKCNAYQVLGMEWSRCMSLASSGLPVTVCAPETTHSLEPAIHESQGMGAVDRPASEVSQSMRASLLLRNCEVSGAGWSGKGTVSGNVEDGGRSRQEFVG